MVFFPYKFYRNHLFAFIPVSSFICVKFTFLLLTSLTCWWWDIPLTNVIRSGLTEDVPWLEHIRLQIQLLLLFAKALRRELKEKEYSVLNAIDQARVFLADQPIEAPEEPRRNLQSKTGETDFFIHHKNTCEESKTPESTREVSYSISGPDILKCLTEFQDLVLKFFF